MFYRLKQQKAVSNETTFCFWCSIWVKSIEQLNA